MYDNAVRCRVLIVRRDVMYGTTDYEDPPELREDRDIECFEVLFETTTGESPAFCGGGQYFSLEDAIRHAEAAISAAVEWVDVS